MRNTWCLPQYTNLVSSYLLQTETWKHTQKAKWKSFLKLVPNLYDYWYNDREFLYVQYSYRLWHNIHTLRKVLESNWKPKDYEIGGNRTVLTFCFSLSYTKWVFWYETEILDFPLTIMCRFIEGETQALMIKSRFNV